MSEHKPITAPGPADAAIIKGLLAKGYKQSVIASHLGFRNWHISDIYVRRRHADIEAAPDEQLPDIGLLAKPMRTVTPKDAPVVVEIEKVFPAEMVKSVEVKRSKKKAKRANHQVSEPFTVRVVGDDSLALTAATIDYHNALVAFYNADAAIRSLKQRRDAARKECERLQKKLHDVQTKLQHATDQGF